MDSKELDVVANPVLDLGQGLFERLLDFMICASPLGRDDDFPTILRRKGEAGGAELLSALASALAHDAGRLVMR
jgi:hypothetical protein